MRDKIILVTGAASGIGKRIAEIFAQAHAIIAIADLDYQKAQQISAAIISDGGKALPLQMDVTNEIEVNKGVEKIIQTFGSIDVLISNAGIQHIASIDQLSITDWKKMIAVHLDGAFLTTKACLQSMYSTNKGGSIIYIGSVHSKEASVLKAPYVTAKHGLEGLCKVVAKEGGPKGVRANMICPGFVRTALVDKQIPEQAEKLGLTEEEVIKDVMLKDTVDGQFTTLDDVAKVALFLASFDSNALTGQSLIVSHGWCMQ